MGALTVFFVIFIAVFLLLCVCVYVWWMDLGNDNVRTYKWVLLDCSLTHSLLLFWLSFYYAAAAARLLFFSFFYFIFEEPFYVAQIVHCRAIFFPHHLLLCLFYFLRLLYRNFYTILLSVVTWMFHLIHFFIFLQHRNLFFIYSVHCVCVCKFDLYCKNVYCKFLHWQKLY